MSERLELDDVQGLLARGYGGLPEAAFLLLAVQDPASARAALRRLAPQVTSAARSPQDCAVNVALTADGVRVLTGAPLHSGFAEPFARGMTSPYRSRLLGDTGEDDPAGWAWGGPGTPAVHVLVLLYARDADGLRALDERVQAGLDGLCLVRRLDTDPLSDREPFGFRDGISQPPVAGLPQAGADAVRTGEFVLGYVNEHGQRTWRPRLTPGEDPEHLLPRDPDDPAAPDLGRNGSYLVLRTLEQDVAGFWAYVGAHAQDPAGRALLAAKLVGRWPSGAPLVLAPEHDDPALAEENAFGYGAADAEGLRCPLGAHVRRANPRDALEPRPGTPRSLEVNRRHRLLRRGRSYTGPVGERGVHFVCLGANLARQYEFVQHSWLNDPGFNGLVDSTDPLVGPRHGGGGTFREPAQPLRRRHTGLPQFVHVRGGAYFFLPGLRALQHLSREPLAPSERTPSMASTGYHAAPHWRAFRALAHTLDVRRGWDRLPTPLGLAVLIGLRDALRRDNLHDTGVLPALPQPPLPAPTPAVTAGRTVDGSWNDLEHPRAGMAGTRFGRNVPLDAVPRPTRAEVLTPSPRQVSRELMTRTDLAEATSVNALVAPWLQWMIRDWFSHGQSPTDDPWQVELADDDPWPDRPMSIPRTMDDPTRPPGAPAGPRTSVNTCSHWWDASQIYGTTPDYQRAVRTGEGGMLRVQPDGTLPIPGGEGGPVSEPGFWLGLVVLQTVFTLEHNAVCAALHEAYPAYGDEELFQRARLVVAALIAKIHTTEWTPAVISHPTTVTGMRANWWGLAGERISTVLGRISGSEVISGIPGAETDSYGVPYSLTEEFTAVYRMHPLMPDEFLLRSHLDDAASGPPTTLRDMSGEGALKVLGDVSLPDLLYSFGTLHPGLVALHNFPHFLQEFVRPDGRVMDLAAVDVLRHRELGVPRYCAFRRALGMTVPTSFEELTEDPATAATIRRLYDGDLEAVDLMVGLYGERRPAGFAFSATAFRIFIVMASRRLNSDRFLTTDFTPAVYTPVGLRWIADNTMLTVLLRHYPQLRPALRGLDNAFAPWHRATVPS